MTLTCVNCHRNFDSREGYSGSAEAPYCFEGDCFKVYLGDAASVRKAEAQAVNGFDNEQYAESQRRRKG